MKLTTLMTLSLVSVPLLGCAVTTGNYCDIAEPLYFHQDSSVQMLIEQDRELLRNIVTHNEQWSALCGN
jgi:hypothetical protein